VASAIALFINPFGWRGVTAPFVEAQSLGYGVAETDTFMHWGQAFLIRRTFDPEWASVFADRSTIVLPRRNAVNADVIRAFEIPPSRFGVGHD
jgi:hypothetical protein